MPAKRSLFVATCLAAAFAASSSAFALANGVFATRHPDRVGTFAPIDEQLIPAVTTTTRQPASTRASTPPEPMRTAPDTEPPSATTRVTPVGPLAPRSQQTTTTTVHRRQRSDDRGTDDPGVDGHRGDD